MRYRLTVLLFALFVCLPITHFAQPNEGEKGVVMVVLTSVDADNVPVYGRL